MSKVVGLVGLARSGKDSAGAWLNEVDNFAMMSFAGPLKEAAKIIFNLSDREVHGVGYDREQPHEEWGISVREMLQKLGTESVRDIFGVDHWVRLAEARLRDAEARGQNVVFTDVRFDNEVEMLRAHGALIVGLVRTGDAPEVRDHPSEAMARDRLSEVTDTIIHAGDLKELYDGLGNLYDDGVLGASRG